ncbi:hypothetical protein GY45DRAFT_1359301 [Cubamyces sp. BRFM 1775]|nr:hypothetical protein GY45DRAFT_1359301 [Cubamyces sp. BRFM 1775]
MLARLPSTLSSATRSSSHIAQRLSSQVRFTSSDAGAPQRPSGDGAQAAPRKRAIPIASNLGDITISNKPRQGGQRRDGGGNGGANRQQGQGQQRPRSNNFNRDGAEGDRSRVNAGERRQSSGNNGQRNFRRNNQGNAQNTGQQPRQDRQQGEADSRLAQSQAQGQTTQSRPPRRRSAPPQEPFNLPAVQAIQLSSLDDLFGPPATNAPSERSTTSLKAATQDRIQTFLERAAGDYSRYVPRALPTTDVTKLSPLQLSEFVLSKRKDVGLQSRHNALTIVEKFVGADKGAQARAP